MISTRILVLALLATSALAEQETEETKKTNVEFDYDQLARILEAPIFRQAQANSDEGSSYFPHAFEPSEPKEETQETKTTQSSYLVPIPALMLQPPREGAIDYFASESIPETPAPTFAPYLQKPLIKIAPESLPENKPAYQDSYLPINPLSKQLDLPLSGASIYSLLYPPVPSTELELPNEEPYNQQFNPNLPANIAQYQPLSKEDLYKLSPELLPPLYPSPSLDLEVPKAESIKPSLSVPTQTFPKKYNPSSEDVKFKKPYKNFIPIEVSDYKKYNNPQKLVYQPLKPIIVTDEDSSTEQVKKQSYEKERHKFEELQKKLQNKKENELRQQKELEESKPKKSEPETSETGFNTYHQGTVTL